MLAIIGGSGFEKFEGFQVLEKLPRATPFGETSSGFKRVSVNGVEALFISRHGEHHEVLPTEINYRANIYALKALGARAVLSFSAVGSLQPQLQPGELVIPLQYIDRTKGIREHTFCGSGIVGHMSLAHPVERKSAERVFAIAQKEGVKGHLGGTYVCIEGPNFSTYAESVHYRALNADIIGMTNYPEYALAREAGLAYLPCCFVTDYDCWDQSRPHVTLEEVITIMRQNNGKAFKILSRVLAEEAGVLEGSRAAEEGLKTGLMTPMDAVPAKHRDWLEVLRG